MLKQLQHIFLALSVVFATGGVVVSKHYCSGELRSTGLFSTKTCCGEAAAKAMGCCHSEFEIHKVDDDFSASSPFVLSKFSPEIVGWAALLIIRYHPPELAFENDRGLYRPPGPPGKSLLILHQVFRI